MRAVEMYYTPMELSLMLRLHVKTVLRKIRSGEYGKSVVNLAGADEKPIYRVPASAVNAYLDARRIFRESDLAEPGIRACSQHELRMKAATKK